MAEDNTQQLGLNASDYFREVDKIMNKNKDWAQSVFSVINFLNQKKAALSDSVTHISKYLDSTTKITAEIGKLNGQFVGLRQHITEVTQEYDKSLGTIDSYTSALSRATEAETALFRQQATMRKGAAKSSTPLAPTNEDIEKEEMLSRAAEGMVKNLKDQAVAAQLVADNRQRLADRTARLNKEQENNYKTGIKVTESRQRELNLTESSARQYESSSLGLETYTSKLNAASEAETARYRSVKANSAGASTSAKDYTDKLVMLDRATSGMVENLQAQGRAAEAAAIHQQVLAEKTARLTKEQEENRKTNIAAMNLRKQQQLEESRTRTGGNFGNFLSARFIGTTPGSEADINRVSAAIGDFTKYISNGTVKASRAFQILNSVMKGTGEVFEGVENTMAKAANRIIKGSENLKNNLAKSFETTRDEMGKTSKASLSLGQAMEKTTQRVILSWQGMVRIMLIQSLHTILGRIIAALQTGITEAQKFQIGISEIRTISQDNQLGFRGWAESVRELSDRFGAAPLDVVAGAYEAVSNQVASGTKTFKFMNEALEFARVTQANTRDSVNLLSSAINSFKMNVDDAHKISSVFFNTINYGRVRASELANTFGRVGPLASALGVTFEEVNAAIATLTINGVPATEAYTLINNVLTHLLKPGKEMKEFFKEIGVSTGEAAIAAYGYAGVLRLIEERTKGSSEGLGALFQDMRAIRGIVGQTGSYLEGFEKNLQRISDIEPFDLSTKIRMESPAARFEVELRKISNMFIDFGSRFIGILDDWVSTTDAAGNRVSKLASAVGTLVSWLGKAVTVYGVYKAVTLAEAGVAAIRQTYAVAEVWYLLRRAQGYNALTAAVIAFRNTTLLTTALLNPTVLITAAFSAAIYFWQEQAAKSEAIRSKLETIDADVQKMAEEQTKALRKNLNDQNEATSKALQDRLGLYLQYLAKVNKGITTLEQQHTKALESINKQLDDVFDLAAKKMEKVLSELKNQIQIADRAISEIRDLLKEREDKTQKSTFEKSIVNLPENEQISKTYEQIENLKKRVAGVLAENKKIFNEFQKAPDKNIDAAERMKANFELSKKYMQEIEDLQGNIDKRKDTAQDTLKKKQEQLAEAARKDSQSDAAALGAKALKEAMIAEQQIRQKKAKPDEVKAAEAATRAARDNLAAIREKNRETNEDTGQDKLKKEIEEQKKIVAAAEAITGSEKFRKVLQDGYNAGLKEQVKLFEQIKAAQEAAANKQALYLEVAKDAFKEITKFKLPEIKTPEDQKKAMAEFDEVVLRLKSAKFDDPEIMKDIIKKREQLLKESNARIATETIKQNAEELQKRKEAVDKQLKETADKQATNVEAEHAAKAKAVVALEQLQKEIGSGVNALRDKEDNERLKRLADKYVQRGIAPQQKDIRAFSSTPWSDAPDLMRFFVEQATEEIKRSQDPARIRQLIAAVAGMQDLPSGMFDAKGAESANVKNAKNAALEAAAALRKAIGDREQIEKDRATALKNAEDISAALNSVPTSIVAQIQAQQKLVTSISDLIKGINAAIKTLKDQGLKFAGGGRVPGATGTDTVNAWLSPGEFVVRASQAQKFYHTLKMINDGTLYMSNGGFVPNIRSAPMPDFNFGAQESVSIGNINIHMQANGELGYDAVQIARAVKQEIRRGRV